MCQIGGRTLGKMYLVATTTADEMLAHAPAASDKTCRTVDLPDNVLAARISWGERLQRPTAGGLRRPRGARPLRGVASRRPRGALPARGVASRRPRGELPARGGASRRPRGALPCFAYPLRGDPAQRDERRRSGTSLRSSRTPHPKFLPRLPTGPPRRTRLSAH